MNRKTAFTLAETLIVMGIIGIVAALTLPNLNSSTGEKEKVVKLKKIYSDLNDATTRAIAVYGEFENWFLNDTTATSQYTRYINRITDFIKTSKISGNSLYLSDGTMLTIRDNLLPTEKLCIDVDIDGNNKGKNSYGFDTFIICVTKEGTVTPAYDAYPQTTFGASCEPKVGGIGCAAWVINFENLDYLKADNQGKCPNGTTLSATANPPVTSCK